MAPVYSSSDRVACRLTHTVPCAHQKPITALKAAAGRLVTGSQDHTLRVSGGPCLGHWCDVVQGMWSGVREAAGALDVLWEGFPGVIWRN